MDPAHSTITIKLHASSTSAVIPVASKAACSQLCKTFGTFGGVPINGSGSEHDDHDLSPKVATIEDSLGAFLLLAKISRT